MGEKNGIARLFNATPKEDMSGICLDTTASWEVSGPRHLASFLRALPSLVPNDAILYLEGHRPAKAVEDFLNARCVPEVSHLAMGTIWPKPHVHHLLATPENLNSLADLAEQCAVPEIADHIHVYKCNDVLLQWYDAFSGDPMCVSFAISEAALGEFCGQLSLTYRTCDEGVEPRSPAAADKPRR